MIWQRLGLAAWLAVIAAAAPLPAPAGEASGDALRVAGESRDRWAVGTLRVREHHGRARIQAELVADGVVIAHLRVDPATGDLVPSTALLAGPLPPDLTPLRAAAARALARVTIGRWAWPTEKGRAWRVPLQYEGHVIGTIKVDVQRHRLLAKDEDHDPE